MAFIVNDPLPKNCTECNYRCGCNLLTREGNYAEGCPIVSEIDADTNLITMDSAVKALIESIKDVDKEELYSADEKVLMRVAYQSAIYRIKSLPIVLGKAIL